MNILVIDDNIEIRDLLEMTLLEKGHFVYSAENGKQGIETLSKQKIDFVISDIQMPIMDGYQFLVMARNRFGRKPPIVLVTGSSNYTPEQIYQAGADGYFEKPYDLNVLLRGLKEVA